MNKNKIVCIVGPTASGKTALSVELAKLLKTEIVSSDSMQIYKGLSIGTAKPTEEEMQGIVHHMLDVLDPDEQFSVAKYVQMADECVKSLISKGKVPIIVGGTGLYINSLIEGNTFENNKFDPEIRERLYKEYDELGAEHMFELLSKVDEQSAYIIHPNNIKRVIRALEVYYQTGIPFSKVTLQNREKMYKYDACIIGVCPEDRETLYENIEIRVDEMVKNGIVEEARRVFENKGTSLTANQAIGYKEFFPYFEGYQTLLGCIDKLKRETRRYAKRQLTWFGRDDRVQWIFYKKYENLQIIRQNSTHILMNFGVL